MEIRLNCNTYIEIDKLIQIIKISCEIESFKYEKNNIEGLVIISGIALDDNEHEFKNTIPFSIVTNDDVDMIESITIDSFDYFVVEGRGIETDFDIIVKYNVINEPLFIEENKTIETEEDETRNVVNLEYEEIKNDITIEKDVQLSKLLEIKDDNKPTEVTVLPKLKSDYKKIRLILNNDG